jgi:hypothetical protein
MIVERLRRFDHTDVSCHRVPGYRPLAFSPPYGNCGQLATNDSAIPRLLLEPLYETFTLVFTHDRPGIATTATGASRPIGRFDMDHTNIDAVIASAFQTR